MESPSPSGINYVYWKNEEIDKFFQALKGGIDFNSISKSVGTKNPGQVRDLFYRVMKKVNSLLGRYGYPKVTKSQENIFFILRKFYLLYQKYGDLTAGGVTIPKETEGVFSEEFYNSVNQTSPKKNDVSKITVQLYPVDNENAEMVQSSNNTARLQLKVKPSKKISFVIDHLHKKWNKPVEQYEIMLFSYDSRYIDEQESWDKNTSFSSVKERLGNPDIVRLEYSISV